MRVEQPIREQSLDSLLDTMANVVGILIVLVAVTQLSVGDAVERIRDRAAGRAVSETDLARNRSEQKRLQAALSSRAEIRQRLRARAPSNAPAHEALERVLGQLEGAPVPDAWRGLRAEALRARLGAETQALSKLDARVASLANRLTRLETVLTSLPTESRPKRARLPDPRPPPPGSRELAFFCRRGRIENVDLAWLIEGLDRGMRAAVGAGEGRFILNWNERSWIQNHFDKEFVGGRGFRWRFVDLSGSRFVVSLNWVGEDAEKRGETLLDLELADSAYRTSLQRFEPSRRYVRFYVWSDSYDVYLEARYEAEAAGYAASWVPIDAKEEIGGDIIDHGGPKPRVFVD